MTHLDTTTEFLSYIRQRESLAHAHPSISESEREEDLLALFLESDRQFPGSLVTETSLRGRWEAFVASGRYQRKVGADRRDSYEWDSIVDRISKEIQEMEVEDLGYSLDENEWVVRPLALERRVTRRALGRLFNDFYEKGQPAANRTPAFRRFVSERGVGYVLMLAPEGWSREARLSWLRARCFCERGTLPEVASDVLGVCRHTARDGYTDEFFRLEQKTWTPQDVERAASIATQCQFRMDAEGTAIELKDFPDDT